MMVVVQNLQVRKSVVLLVLTLELFTSFYLYKFIHLKNFRTVIPNEIYRSGQPTAKDIEAWRDSYHIKSILNLRGHVDFGTMGKAFDYSKSIGLEAKVVKLFSNELPTIDELDKIIDFIINSPKPLLIHCMRGVDRTGLISAVALILNNYSLERASDELSWKKGFLPYREQDKFRIVINNYEQWLIDNKLNTNKDNFVFWAKNIYRQ